MSVYRAGTLKRERRTNAALRQLDDQILAVLAEDHPQSVRHVFYRMTNPRLPEPVEKSERGYRHVQGRMVKLRRAGLLPYGWIGAALHRIKPDGTIVAEFNVETNAVRWILQELLLTSPELTGAYERSHTVFADGVEVISPGRDLPDAREFVIASDLPYARKLDPKDGLPARSKQAPKGVYAALAAVAAKRFDGEATIRFTFREIPLQDGSAMRQPAITVRPA